MRQGECWPNPVVLPLPKNPITNAFAKKEVPFDERPLADCVYKGDGLKKFLEASKKREAEVKQFVDSNNTHLMFTEHPISPSAFYSGTSDGEPVAVFVKMPDAADRVFKTKLRLDHSRTFNCNSDVFVQFRWWDGDLVKGYIALIGRCH